MLAKAGFNEESYVLRICDNNVALSKKSKMDGDEGSHGTNEIVVRREQLETTDHDDHIVREVCSMHRTRS